jgi:hypothetical protein
VIDRLRETGGCCGMEMNVKRTNVMSISSEPSTLQIMVDQKQLENVEYFNYLGSMITNYARCTREARSRIALTKAAVNKKTLLTSKLELVLRKTLVKCYIWSIALYGAKNWTLWKVDQKYLEYFEMWCWRRVGKIRLTNHVRNEEVLYLEPVSRGISYIK